MLLGNSRARQRLDQAFVERFANHAGDGISQAELEAVCRYKNIVKLRTHSGRCPQNHARILEEHPELKIALLHIDVDVYAPSKAVLDHLYDRIVPGGLLVLDDWHR